MLFYFFFDTFEYVFCNYLIGEYLKEWNRLANNIIINHPVMFTIYWKFFNFIFIVKLLKIDIQVNNKKILKISILYNKI